MLCCGSANVLSGGGFTSGPFGSSSLIDHTYEDGLLKLIATNNLSPDEVNLALDLKELRSDPAYLSHLKNRGLNEPPSPCKPTIQ